MPAARLLLLTLLCLAPAPALAEGPCAEQTFEDARYTVCSFPSGADLRLFWRNGDGRPYQMFPMLADALAQQGLTLTFAMNGGMYDTGLSPIGLYVEDGVELSKANTATVKERPVPNFYKKPNGVFLLSDGAASIMETAAYLKRRPAADYATQSGPLLVVDGQLHPAFIAGSRDTNRRNGVGVDRDGGVHFVISETAVNFETFARFFRDRLKTPNALYLDGGWASALYAPGIQRSDWPGHGGLGPIIGAIAPASP